MRPEPRFKRDRARRRRIDRSAIGAREDGRRRPRKSADSRAMTVRARVTNPRMAGYTRYVGQTSKDRRMDGRHARTHSLAAGTMEKKERRVSGIAVRRRCDDDDADTDADADADGTHSPFTITCRASLESRQNKSTGRMSSLSLSLSQFVQRVPDDVGSRVPLGALPSVVASPRRE